MPNDPIPTDQRYLRLALINMGEGLTELGNVMQRGGSTGADCGNVRLALMRAMSALDGVAFVPPSIDAKHKEPA